jgi:hypothetical protein
VQGFMVANSFRRWDCTVATVLSTVATFRKPGSHGAGGASGSRKRARTSGGGTKQASTEPPNR